MDLKRIVNCFRSDWLLLLSSNLLVLSPLILLAYSTTPPPLSISRRHYPRSLRRRNPPSCSSRLLKGIVNVQALRSSRLVTNIRLASADPLPMKMYTHET
ncbi:unnamed protein product [Arabidopsis lyrata]|nr:unnamed protein product [Arabidopsis lyrata]